jgi:hypothetical protein
MTKDLIRDGKLDREAAGVALRSFLENIVRAAGLDLKVNVRVARKKAKRRSLRTSMAGTKKF